MEYSLTAQKKALVNKLPDIEEALNSVEFLRKKNEGIKTHFALSDNIIAKAEVASTTSVFLWLGVRKRFLMVMMMIYDEPILITFT